VILTPAYQIVVGDRKVDTTDDPLASTVEQLLVDLDMDGAADRVLLRLGSIGSFEPKEGDEATVEMGYAEDAALTLVFTGRVETVEPGLFTTRVTVLSRAALLFATVGDRTFQDKTAGDIVSDLAQAAGVTVARADAGIMFQAYFADGRRSAFAHIHYLAELCGFDAFVDPAGQLVFRTATQATRQHVFEHAKHIIELEVGQSRAAAASVDVRGESPGTSRGDHSWAWLTKDTSPSRATAGSGTPARVIEQPVLRTRDAAQQAADAALARVTATATHGRLRTFGRPQVAVGDAIRVKDVPDPRLNGDFRVRSVRHRLDKAHGFSTQIEFRGAP
jgi:phage protein D